FNDAALSAILPLLLLERRRVLWKATAAVAGAWVQEVAADAVVHAHRARHVVNVAADTVAEVRDLVDEGNLGREEGVRRVLRKLRRLKRGDDDGRLYQVERAVEVAHDGD